MKKILLILGAIAMFISLSACAPGSDTETKQPKTIATYGTTFYTSDEQQAPVYVTPQETPAENQAVMVWIPRTGSKYHNNPSCSNMKDPTEVPIDEAISLGYGRCSKCW